MKPTFLVVNTTTAHTHVIDTLGNEYPTWLLLPEHRDRVSDEIREKFRYQREVVEMASRLLPDTGVFVDVGAGLGAWTVQLGCMRPNAKIFAFEPCPPLFLALCANVLLNRLWNVVPRELAVSNATGTIPLYEPVAGDLSSSTTVPFAGMPWRGVATQQLREPLVPARISLLKVHTSGAEHRVISGQYDLLERHAVPVFFELRSGPSSALVNALDVLGYETAELLKNHYLAAPKKELKRAMRKAKG